MILGRTDIPIEDFEISQHSGRVLPTTFGYCHIRIYHANNNYADYLLDIYDTTRHIINTHMYIITSVQPLDRKLVQ